MTGKAIWFSDQNSKTILEEDHKNIKVSINSLFLLTKKFDICQQTKCPHNSCLFVCNRGDTNYTITAGSRQGSLAKLLFLIPRPALSSYQHRTLVCLFWSGHLHCTPRPPPLSIHPLHVALFMDELKVYVPDVSSSMCGHGGVFFLLFFASKGAVYKYNNSIWQKIFFVLIKRFDFMHGSMQ